MNQREVTTADLTPDGDVKCAECENATPLRTPNQRRLSFDCEHCDATLRVTVHALGESMMEHDRDDLRGLQNDVGELADRVRPDHPALAGFLEGVYSDLQEAEQMLTESTEEDA